MILIISLTWVYGCTVHQELSKSAIYIDCGEATNHEQEKQMFPAYYAAASGHLS